MRDRIRQQQDDADRVALAAQVDRFGRVAVIKGGDTLHVSKGEAEDGWRRDLRRASLPVGADPLERTARAEHRDTHGVTEVDGDSWSWATAPGGEIEIRIRHRPRGGAYLVEVETTGPEVEVERVRPAR